MPPEGVPPRSHDEILSYEELLVFAAAAVAAGITKVRVTGGEPLVRKPRSRASPTSRSRPTPSCCRPAPPNCARPASNAST
jgi:hypothetical protein